MNNNQPPPSSPIYTPTIVALPPPAPSIAPSPSLLSTSDTITSTPSQSSPWQPDPTATHCTSCHSPFDAFNRRHHCRLCGMVFCHPCSCKRSLIPPTALVLRQDHNPNLDNSHVNVNSSYVSLQSPSLEHRITQARLPQRVCNECHDKLSPLQNELQSKNSNAVRYNFIKASGGLRSLCNSPLAFTLGHEVRKAAYALGNLMPRGRRRGGMVSQDDLGVSYSYPPREADPLFGNSDKKMDWTLRKLDGVHVPSRLLRKAKGIAIITCAKGGLGFAGFEFGTGLVVARTDNIDSVSGNNDDISWSAPSAIGLAGFAWGALIGAQLSDHIFLLMTDEAVRLFSTQDANVQLGVDVGVALGPVGRSAEADLVASRSAMAPIYTYSLSKGLYAGVSMEGKLVVSRPWVNEKFYGKKVEAEDLLNGSVPRPPAAQPLYDAIKRCLVYGDCISEGVSVPDVANRSVDREEFSVSENSYMDNTHGRRESRMSLPPGGLLERLSHTTGLGMAVSPSPPRTQNPYNLAARYDPTWQPNFSE